MDLENGWMVVPFIEILLEGLKKSRFKGHEIKGLVLDTLSLRDHLRCKWKCQMVGYMCLKFLGKIWVGNNFVNHHQIDSS